MPGSVARLIRFAKLPGRAVATIVSVLDQDESFRALVADGLAEDEPDRVSWLFLVRPPGWLEDLMILVEVATEENEQAAAEARLRDAERHLAATTAALESTRSDLDVAERRMAELHDEIGDLRSGLAERDAQIDRLTGTNRQLGAERDRAVKNLKLSEELANTRLEKIRELEAAPVPAGATDVVDDPGAGGTDTDDTAEVLAVDPRVLVGPFREAIAALERLTAALGDAARSLGLDEVADPPDGAGVAERSTDRRAGDAGTGARGSPTGSRPQRPVRRRPIRLERGAVAGSADGIRQLLTTPGVILLVDGYNVAMEAWPTLSKAGQRDSLIQMTSSLASRSGADIHLVFDGIGDGSRPNVASALPVRVHFSDAETEADDVILEMAASITGPVVVVSNDRRILSGAEGLGANVVTSTQMIRFVRGRVSGPEQRGPGGRR